MIVLESLKEATGALAQSKTEMQQMLDDWAAATSLAWPC